MNTGKSSFLNRIGDLLKGEKRTKIIVVIGLVGIVLIFISSFFEGDDKKEKDSDSIKVSDAVSEDTSAYKEQLEKELEDMLKSISGVGNVKVMLTIEGTTEYVYAEEISLDSDVTNDKTSESHQNKVVVIDNNGNKEALVKKIIKPQVSGVVIVCQGGDDVFVKEQVYQAVSTVLNISTSRICVARLKS